MALSHNDRVEILSMRLALDDANFRQQLSQLNDRQLGTLVKQLSLLDQIARDTGNDINTYIARGFDAASNTARQRIQELTRMLQTDIHGTINLSPLGIDAFVDKAYTSMGREHARYIAGGLSNATFNNRQLSGMNTAIDPTSYIQSLSEYGEQITRVIADAVRTGLSAENIRRLYGNEAYNLINQGWTGRDDAEMLQMGMAMANVRSMYDNVGFMGGVIEEKSAAVDQIGRNAIGSIQKANDVFNVYFDKLSGLVESQRLNFDRLGQLTSISSVLNLGGGQRAHMTVTAQQMQSLAQMGNPDEIISWVRQNSQFITERHTDNIKAQEEEYKKLLTQEYDLQLKIDQAQRDGNEQQAVELKRQQEIVQLKKQQLNDYRATQIDTGSTTGRTALTDTTGDITNKDSIAYLNHQLQLRNQNINRINEQATSERELVRMVEQEAQLRARLSTTQGGSVQEANINRQISGIMDRSVEEENVINKIITLENQRLGAWKKSRAAISKGNNEEANEYSNLAYRLELQQNNLKNQASATGVLTQSSYDFLNTLKQITESEKNLVLAREKDINTMKQQTRKYNEISSGLNKYTALLKEKSKLESTKDTSGSGVYANAYANVNAQISQLTTNFSKLIDIQSNGTLQLKAWSNDLGITKEQYDNLNTSIQNTNQTITNNAIQAKQEQDLQMINKMVEAYTRLKTAQIQLQQAKDRNYNDAEIARRTREVQLAEEHFNKLKQENSELAKSETYRNAIANADNKMATSISYTNQNMTQQLTLLQRLRNNLQRTAAVAFNFNIFNRIFMKLRQGISDVIQKVKDFDKAMTDIQMVTGKTDSSVKQLLADYSELAKELGTTTEAVAEGEFVRPLKIL